MRIHEKMRHCIAYFYASKEAAENGVDSGATGVFVSVSGGLGHTHVYLVTNDHVVGSAKRDPLTFVRVNRTRGVAPAILSLGDRAWHRHPDGDDVAACYLGCNPSLDTNAIYVPSGTFVTRQDAANGTIGIGDDCVMIGRFTLHSGTLRNTPVVRFGNISMLPEEDIEIETRGHTQEAFLVEMRSRMGFSGSPVFLSPHKGSSRTPGVESVPKRANARCLARLVHEKCAYHYDEPRDAFATRRGDRGRVRNGDCDPGVENSGTPRLRGTRERANRS